MDPASERELRVKILRYFDRQLPEGQESFNPAQVAKVITCSKPHVEHLIEAAKAGKPGLVATNIAIPGAKRKMWRIHRRTLVRYMADNANINPSNLS